MGAINAEDRDRTGTVITDRRILSPVRLPIPPPPRHKSGKRDSNPRPPPPWQGGALPLSYFRICRLEDSNFRPPLFTRQVLCQLS